MLTQQKKVIFPLFLLSTFLFVWNFIAIKLYLYWTTDWVDAVSHFAGGAIVSLGIFLFIGKTLGQRRTFLLVLFTLFVGVLWEFFELGTAMVHFSDPGYLGDTLLDLVLDSAGAFMGARYIQKT